MYCYQPLSMLLSVKNYFLCAWRTLLHGLVSLAIFLSFYTDYFFIHQTNVLLPLSSFYCSCFISLFASVFFLHVATSATSFLLYFQVG